MAVNIFHRALIGAMEFAPESLVWRFSKRYIAGKSLQEAFDTVRTLNGTGCSATIDVLGEDSASEERVLAARDLYIEALQEIQATTLDCNVSVKLSDLGLRLDTDLCKQVMQDIVSAARAHDNFVRIDMEDSTVTTVTLEIYDYLRESFDNVGIVIQACLRRSEADIAWLIQNDRANVRICKGIYIEEEEISFRKPDEIRQAYQNRLQQLFDGGATRVGIATHDPLLISAAKKSIRETGVDKDNYEFQMLLGVAEHLRGELVAEGHPLRVYVPFGELWFKYSMRRLAENPQIAGHIIRNLLTPG